MQYSVFSFIRTRYTYGSTNNNDIYVNEKNNSVKKLGQYCFDDFNLQNNTVTN